MDRTEFEAEVLNGSRTEYVSDDALEFLVASAEFRVIDRSAMEKDEISQTEFVSIALPESADNYSDEDLIGRVKDTVSRGGTDTQKYQMRDDGDAPTVIEIWRHGNGYSAFALAE